MCPQFSHLSNPCGEGRTVTFLPPPSNVVESLAGLHWLGGMRGGLSLGRQESLHCAEPGMAGGFSVKVEAHGEDGGRAGAEGEPHVEFRSP